MVEAPSSFPTDRSKAVLLLQFFFVCRWFHIWSLFLLFVSHLSFFRVSGRLCFVMLICVFSLIYFLLHQFQFAIEQSAVSSHVCDFLFVFFFFFFVFKRPFEKNWTYYVTGSGVRLSVNVFVSD